MSAQIKEFCFNLSPWRIDYLGGLIYPGNAHSEPRITVYLSELAEESGDPLSNQSLAKPFRHEVATINVGQMSLLKTGSVWIDGVCVPPAELSKQRSFSVTHDQFSLVRFDDNVRVGGVSHSLFSATRYRIGAPAAAKLASSWLAIAYDPAPGVDLIAIPSTVIFQKCIATSPKAIRRLVFGEIDKIVDPSCGFLDEEPNTFFVELFKDFRDAEAKAIANLKADPIGKIEYARFRKALILDSANHDHSQPNMASLPHIKLSLPFSNRIELTGFGKSLPFEIDLDGTVIKKWGFLVTEIISLKTRLVFDRLVVGRKNDAQKGENSDDPDLPGAYGLPVKTPVIPEEPYQPIASGVEPSNDLEKLSLEAAGDFTAEDLELVDNPKDVQHYRSCPRTSGNVGEFDGLGATGDVRAIANGVAEVDILTSQSPKIPVTLDEFFMTLANLATLGYEFQTIAVAQAYRQKENGHDVVNFMPRRIKGIRSWHLSSDDVRASPRAYVVAQIKHGGVWHYLIELERKGTDAFALLHIRSHDGCEIEWNRLAQFMINVAVANGWRAKKHYKGWVFESLEHPKKNRIEALAKAIIKAL